MNKNQQQPEIPQELMEAYNEAEAFLHLYKTEPFYFRGLSATQISILNHWVNELPISGPRILDDRFKMAYLDILLSLTKDNLGNNNQHKHLIIEASKHRFSMLVMLLINAGADLSVTDKDGRTAMVVAETYRKKDILELLTKAQSSRMSEKERYTEHSLELLRESLQRSSVAYESVDDACYDTDYDEDEANRLSLGLSNPK